MISGMLYEWPNQGRCAGKENGQGENDTWIGGFPKVVENNYNMVEYDPSLLSVFGANVLPFDGLAVD